jgi:hypothetical protein
MTAPIRVLVCDDRVLIRTGLVTIIGAQPTWRWPAAPPAQLLAGIRTVATGAALLDSPNSTSATASKQSSTPTARAWRPDT